MSKQKSNQHRGEYVRKGSTYMSTYTPKPAKRLTGFLPNGQKFFLSMKLPDLESYPAMEFSTIGADFSAGIQKYPELKESFQVLKEIQALNGEMFKVRQICRQTLGTETSLLIEFSVESKSQENEVRNFLKENFPQLQPIN